MALDKALVVQYYQVLGLPLTASIGEVRQARNQLIQKFHPDKFPQGWLADDFSPENRINIIQTAYQFISQHFIQIQAQFSCEMQSPLLQASHLPGKSHWIYSEIAKCLDDEDEEIKRLK